MSLGAVNVRQELFENEANFARWVEHPSSSILHHDDRCCEEARLWFLSYARSMEIGAISQFNIKTPAWLSRLFTWGPSEWPIAWCQLVRQQVIDCGVFAALAREIFQAQGHSVHPAQALLSYNPSCTSHWKNLWKNENRKIKKFQRDKLFPWVGDELVYHEVCVLEMPDGEARIYDSTFGQWYLPQSRVGFAALLAIRTECPRLLLWGGKVMCHGEWVEV
jgi:hypothetical protein